MQFSTALLFLLPALSLASPLMPRAAPAASSLPTLTFLFNVTLNLAKPLNPVPLRLGGVQLIEPLVNGTVSGPAMNGTIYPGLAYPTADSANASIQYPTILVYGTSNDNETNFLVQEIGVGPNNNQYTRIQMIAGGKYAYLQEEFILAHIQASRTAAVVNVNCWCVSCNDTVVATINNGTST